MRLSLDDKEALFDIMQHEGYRVLLGQLESHVQAAEQDVLRFNIEVGDERKLLFAKARAEGARKVQKAFLTWLEQFRLASLQASESHSDKK